MHILLTNDDGLHAEGIQTAYKYLKNAGHTVTVCAPDRQRSGQSQAVTVGRPLSVTPTQLPDGQLGFAIDGTPADCSRLGFSTLANNVDMVISGINNGPNLGFDINYSGTVSAALEAAAAGYPAIAISLESSQEKAWERAGEILLFMVKSYSEWNIPSKVVVNINIPLNISKKGHVWCSANSNPCNDYYKKNDNLDNNITYDRLRSVSVEHIETQSDIDYFRQGIVTLSPVTPCQTSEDVLKKFRESVGN